jgi:hypothetical protein
VEPLIRQATQALDVVSVTVENHQRPGNRIGQPLRVERLIELEVAPADLLDGNLKTSTKRR